MEHTQQELFEFDVQWQGNALKPACIGSGTALNESTRVFRLVGISVVDAVADARTPACKKRSFSNMRNIISSTDILAA